MEIQWVQRSEIDDEQWNDFISQSSYPILYAYSWYLDIVAPSWGALVGSEQGRWRVVLPVPLKRKYGFWVVLQPLFCQWLGVFSPTPTTAFEPLLWQALTKRFSYISTYAGRFEQEVFPASILVQSCQNYCLDLSVGYTTLGQNFTTDRRRNLGKALKWDWQLEESQDIRPLIEMFEEYHAHQIEGGVSPRAYSLLRKIFEKLQTKQSVKLWYAVRQGQIEAGAMFAFDSHRIIYLFNAATPTGRRGNARTWLIDRCLRTYAGQAYYFDFESPQEPSIANFYKSFGAVAEPYWQVRYDGLPPWARLVRNIIKKNTPL